MADEVKIAPSSAAQERVAEFVHPSAPFMQRPAGVYITPYVLTESDLASPGDQRSAVTRESVHIRLENGLCVSGVAWGATEAECSLRILSLHGWLDNAASFDHLAPLLVRALQRQR
jgi:hypothetical protein